MRSPIKTNRTVKKTAPTHVITETGMAIQAEASFLANFISENYTSASSEHQTAIRLFDKYFASCALSQSE